MIIEWIRVTGGEAILLDLYPELTLYILENNGSKVFSYDKDFKTLVTDMDALALFKEELCRPTLHIPVDCLAFNWLTQVSDKINISCTPSMSTINAEKWIDQVRTFRSH